MGELISDEWIKTLADGRRVKFTNQEIENDWAFITAQIEGNKVVYSVVLTNANNPLIREEVESHFEDELSKKQRSRRSPIDSGSGLRGDTLWRSEKSVNGKMWE